MRELNERERDWLRGVIEDSENNMSPYACRNADAIREYSSHKYAGDLLRTQYAIDIDKILHSPLYNRGNDKTQVFSFYRNDDITRRSSHVQLVSRIGRIIGHALRLNTDLIEAIAVGHDVGHTPFGHKGEEFLNTLYHAHTGRFFHHNVHSTRVLQNIYCCNLTLPTLDGILCHCGEKAFARYEPAPKRNFADYNALVENCYTKEGYTGTLRPCTLEGCVVRISDMIAYLGKDRQDAYRAGLKPCFRVRPFGKGNNSDIITAVVTDIVENSIGKPYLSMSSEIYDGILAILKENGEKIYQNADVVTPYYEVIQPMMELLYHRFLDDLTAGRKTSPLYRHYLNDGIIRKFYFSGPDEPRPDLQGPHDIVVDFIACMTDDYFLDVFSYLFPGHVLADKVRYVEYFDERFMT